MISESASCILQTQIKSLFQHIHHCQVPTFLLRRRNMWSRIPEPVERENAIPLWANRWRWLISPTSPQSSLIPKKISETTLVAENAKRGKKKGPKFADVWKQIKSGVALQLSLIWWWTFLNVSGASSAQWPPGSRETAQRFSRRYGQSSFD